MKHTPGPWTIGEYGILASHRYGMNDPEVICQFGIDVMEAQGPEEAQANAHLIAAAPEMLEALEAIRARVDGEWDNPALLKYGPLNVGHAEDVGRIVRSAIAKAMGEKP